MCKFRISHTTQKKTQMKVKAMNQPNETLRGLLAFLPEWPIEIIIDLINFLPIDLYFSAGLY